MPHGIAEIYQAAFGKQNDALAIGKLDLIDLRLVCNEPQDYANPIEPSSRGGAKIANVIVKALTLDSSREHHSRIFR